MTDLELIETLWYLVHNHSKLKLTISPFVHQKEMLLESALPEDEANIEAQFENLVREVIINELSPKLQFNVRDVIKNLNIGEYLK